MGAESTAPDFRALFEAAPGCYLILSPDFTIIAVSDAYAKATKTQRAEILGRGLFEVFPDNPDDPATKGTHNLRSSLERVLRKREPDTMPVQKYDIPKPESEGGGFEVRFWSPLNSPVLNPDGSIRYIIHSVVDVTREALNPNEERYRTTLDNIREGCQLIGFDWRYIYLNGAAARHNRRPNSELLGKTMMEMWPGIERTHIFNMLQRSMRDRIALNQETEFVFPDGSKGLFDVRSQPVPEGIFVLSIDITEHRKLEQQLRQSQKMESIGLLAGGIAHDFNNLLTVINGYSSLMLSTMKPGQEMRKDLELIHGAGTRAANLTRQLLAFSRKQVLAPKVLDLNLILSDLHPMLKRLIREDIELNTIPQPAINRVKADPGQLEQVILNLVVNARDAMPSGGKLTIETANVELSEEYARNRNDVMPGPYVMLAVSDTGHGMNAEIKARIFEPFFTTKEMGKGTGLGLSTIFGIVKQSQGHIEVYSEEGRGTTFKVYLPQTLETITKIKSGTLPTVPTGSEVVLVIEDEEGVRGLIRDVLELNGYKVLVAHNGQEAWALAADYKAKIHLVVTDIVMPQMGGPELAERLRAARPTTRFLFTSGYTDNAVIRNGALSSDSDFLHKPFTPAALERKVREVLDRPNAGK